MKAFDGAVSLPHLGALVQCTLQASESLFFCRITFPHTLQRNWIDLQQSQLIRRLNSAQFVGPELFEDHEN